jgi:uncharacterized protein
MSIPRLRILTALAAVTALALPSLASAHVTLQPGEVAAGGYARLDVRVPNERDDSGTVKVAVDFPHGVAGVSTETVPGWTARVAMATLDTPITSGDTTITREVRRVTWTGDGSQGVVGPGRFQDFGLSMKVPGQAGDTLVFPAVQTYANGEVVRWTGPAGSEHPAPRVALTAAADDAAAGAAGGSSGDGGAPTGLAVAALVVGVLGLMTGGAALVSARNRSRAS